MKFSGKMCLMITLKVKKTMTYPLSCKYSFGKTTGVGGGGFKLKILLKQKKYLKAHYKRMTLH